MSLPQNLGRLSAALTSDASLNIGVGVTPSGSFKLEVGTTSKFTGVATFGSTLSNGTYSYTLPGATGTLALTSDLSGYLPLTGGTLSGALASTFVGTFLGNTVASTSSKIIRISNTGADMAIGIEGATPSEIPSAEGGIAYSTVLKSVGSTSLILGTLSKAAIVINTSQQVTLKQGLTGTTANFTGQLTLGSTITNGTYTYTLPSATGTLALTSALSSYLPLSGGTLTGPLGGTSASFNYGGTFVIPVESPASGSVALTAKTSNGANDIFRWYDGATQLGVFKNSGNVGIGNTTPAAKLEVNGYGSANSIMTQPVAIFNGTNGITLGSDGTNALIGVSNSGTDMIFLKRVTGVYSEAVRITSGGNVEIKSAGKLIAYRSDNARYGEFYTDNTAVHLTSSTDPLRISSADRTEFYNAGSERMRITSAGKIYNSNAPSGDWAMELFSNTSTSNAYGLHIRGGTNATDSPFFVENAAGTSTLFKITGLGNVGIGTTSIASIGTGYTTVDMRGANGSGIVMGTTSASYGYVYADATALIMQSAASTPILFVPGGNEKMRITTGGDVIVKGSLANLTLGSSGAELFFGRNSANYITANGGGGAEIRIISNTNGVVLANGGTSWGSLSDENSKDIIEPIVNACDNLSQFRTIIGKYKTDDKDKRRLFLIAQDVEKVYPEAVFKIKNEEEEESLALNYQDLIPVLVKAIQELSEKIKILENK